ncbi:MAG TPA: hydroxymethylbilane synthase [Blastocatellia bacterium]|nr:hydroxymethylbilane synthase [Blastocatellia bacterium]
MTKETLILGSRASLLALRQAEMVKDRLIEMHPGITITIRRITTTGDRITDAPLARMGGKGLFIKEIEEALLAGEIDLAVHSLKDMPAELPPGVTIAAVTEREDPRDALITREGTGTLLTLPSGARIGTSSLRRSVQLKALRPDLEVLPLRGNVDTRMRKLDAGQYDAIVLAAAGLNRLGLAHRITEWISPDLLLPAIGQGALALETRADDQETLALVGGLNHAPTEVAVTAERAFLRRFGGGCQIPLAAYAEIQGNELRLRGLIASLDGRRLLKDQVVGSVFDGENLGHHLARRLIEAGALDLLES